MGNVLTVVAKLSAKPPWFRSTTVSTAPVATSISRTRPSSALPK